ncbi:hypothetical protein SAMN05428961_11425 [Paenibacillus sp. OK060]|nr:hypothetical protein SAMN05428961_11425 [Paenibacillus sp. OK060]
MKFEYKFDFGPLYPRVYNEESVFEEPIYFETSNDKISYVVDINGDYELSGSLKRVAHRNIGRPGLKNPIIMNNNGVALEYGVDILKVEWRENLKITTKTETYHYPVILDIDPETIQLLEDGVLLTMRKTQQVFLLSNSGKLVTSFGIKNRPGDKEQLNVPMFSVYIHQSRTILICDSINSRVIEIDLEGNIVWQYGNAGELGSIDGLLWKPTCARRLADGRTVIADSKNQRIITVDFSGKIVNEIGHSPVEKHLLTYPRSIQEVNNYWIIANTHKNNFCFYNKQSGTSNFCSSLAGSKLYWPRCGVVNPQNSNEIVIGDGLNNRVLVVNLSTYTTTGSFNDYNHDGQLNSLGDPHHIEVERKTGNLLITLTSNNEIVELNQNGKLLRIWANLDDPHSAKYFSKGIVIANSGKSEIILITVDQKREEINGFYSMEDRKWHTFNRPRFVMPYLKGFLVMDTANQRLVYLIKDDNWYGKVVKMIFPDKLPLKKLCAARWIEIAINGDLLITDTENNRVIQGALIL